MQGSAGAEPAVPGLQEDPMGVWGLAAFAILHGPTVQFEVRVRDLLAGYLEHERRERARRVPGPREREPESALEPAEDEAVGPEVPGAPAPLQAEDVARLVATAAVQLHHEWRDQVLGSVPSQLLLGLSAVADWGVILLGEGAPDLARRFERLRDKFMLREEDGAAVVDEELLQAAEELEALVLEVADRARRLLERLEARGTSFGPG
jgi:hypothetical protein